MLSTSLRLYAATFLEGQSLQKYELIFFIGPHDILSDHLPLSFENIDNAKTFKYFLKPHNEYLLKGRLNTLKRPISAVADNFEVRNIKSVTIRVQNKIKFSLLYDKGSSLHKKIKLEQLRREVI